MKINELRNYKPLDITDLPKQDWNAAEKVLGLDSGDTVVMVETKDDEIAEIAGEVVASALTSYYTKEEVDEIVEDIDVSDQLDNYYTKSQVDAVNAEQNERITANEDDIADLQSGKLDASVFDEAMADETARTESTYAKSSDIPDLTPYATKGWVEMHQYTDQNFVNNKINVAIQAETARTESVYAKKSEIPSVDGLATEGYVDDAIADETARTESTYLKEHQSLDNYYTKSQVDDLIDSVDISDQLADYALSSSVTADINTAIANETARTESTYAKPSQIPSLNGYATEQWVQNQGYLTQHQSLEGLFNSVAYDSNTKRINFSDKGNNVVGYVDATDFIKDGMVDGVYITGSTLVISFNTDAGQEDIEISLTDIFNPANYYDKTAVDNLIAAETARTEATYLKEHQDISGKLDKTDFNTYTGATATVLAGKADVADIPVVPTDVSAFNNDAGYLTQHQSLANYYTKSEVDAEFASAAVTVGNAIDAAVQGLASENYVDNAVSGLATEQYVDDAIAAIPATDLSDYYTKDEVDSEITGATQGLATENYVDTAIGNIPQPDMSDYVSKDELTGNTTTEELEISTDDSSVFYHIGFGGGEYTGYLKETNNPDLVAINVGLIPSIQPMSNGVYIFYYQINGTNYLPTNNNLEQTVSLVEGGDAQVPQIQYTTITASELDEWYIVLDKTNMTVKMTKTLPEVITGTPGVLDDYYTTAQTYNRQEIDQKVAEGGTFDPTAYYNKNDVDGLFADETARTENTYAKPSQIPSLNGYATEQWVENQGYLTGYTETDPTVPSWAKQANKPSYTASEVGAATQSDIDSAIAAETARTEAAYAKPSQIPSLNGYATESWVQNQGYLTQHQDISDKLDKTDFGTYTGATETALSGKQATLESGVNIKTINNQSLLGSGNITIEAAGTVDTVMNSASTNAVENRVIKQYVDSRTVELTQSQYNTLVADDLVDPEVTYIITDAPAVDFDDYYTKDEVDEALDGTPFSTRQIVTTSVTSHMFYVSTALTSSASATGYYYRVGDPDNGTGVYDLSTITNQTSYFVIRYLRYNGMYLYYSGSLQITSSNVNTWISLSTTATTPSYSNRVYAYSPTYNIYSYYLIFDPDRLAIMVATELPIVTGTVGGKVDKTEFETALEEKADRASVTARAATAYYAPGWNTEGVITSETKYYRTALTINGTNYGNVDKSSSTAIPAFYAPTAVGTAGAPLCSSGSGAPTWASYKFSFITQAAYDALATKDSTTIYFIVG